MLAACLTLVTGCGEPQGERGADGSLHRPGPRFAPPPRQPSEEIEQSESSEKNNRKDSSDLSKLSDWTFKGDRGELLSVADPPDALLRFKMNFPRDYKSFTSRNYVAQTFYFLGPNRADASHPSFVVSLIPKGDKQEKQDSPEAALAASMTAIQKTKTKWSTKAIESGMISGVRFVRQEWSGFDKSSNAATSGLFYFGSKGDYLVLFSSQDRDPYARDSIKKAETAFRTLTLGQ